MPRKNSEVFQRNPRIHTDLHRRISDAARARGVSANQEMRDRLQASFEQQELRTIESVARNMQRMIKGGAR